MMPGDGIQNESGPFLKGHETVLVVDDIETVRSFVRDSLIRYGYTVICAEDGMDGLHKFRENKDSINIALLDIMMPKLNGLELFSEIKAIGPDVKVIFMSGHNEILGKSDLCDKIKCISKPFVIKTLLKEIREALDHR